MVFKFLIVLIFIVNVNSQSDETTTPFSSEHSVVSVSRGRNLCQGTLQIIPPLQRGNELIEEFE